MNNVKYITSKKARETLGICNKTLVTYAKAGKIDFITTNGGWRKYNIDKYLRKNDSHNKKKIIYARVSSHDRKDDLARQISFLVEKYPDYEIIKDIGSGVNFKRKGLQKIIELSINNELAEVVVAYKDRLCRIGYDLLEFIFDKYSKTKIIIVNDEIKLPHQEITEDLIEIITVYSSKIHGTRSYKTRQIEEKKEEIS